MSLSDHEARAMAVKVLNKTQLQSLHDQEGEAGRYFLPYEIALVARQDSIRSHWRIPGDDSQQAEHNERIRRELVDLMRAKNCHVNLCDPESRVNFDWHVFHSDIDFAFHGAKRASKQVEESVF